MDIFRESVRYKYALSMKNRFGSENFCDSGLERSKFAKRIIFSDMVIYVVYEFWRHAVLIIMLKPNDFCIKFQNWFRFT